MPASDSHQRLADLGAMLETRIDELSRHVLARIRSDIAFYRDNDVITDDDLLRSTAANLRSSTATSCCTTIRPITR